MEIAGMISTADLAALLGLDIRKARRIAKRYPRVQVVAGGVYRLPAATALAICQEHARDPICRYMLKPVRIPGPPLELIEMNDWLYDALSDRQRDVICRRWVRQIIRGEPMYASALELAASGAQTEPTAQELLESAFVLESYRFFWSFGAFTAEQYTWRLLIAAGRRPA